MHDNKHHIRKAALHEATALEAATVLGMIRTIQQSSVPIEC